MVNVRHAKYLSIAIPVLLMLGNLIPSNLFLSLATVLTFLSFYLSSLGNTVFHGFLKTSAMVCGACALMIVPVVIYDGFFFFDDPSKSVPANIFKSLTLVTPYFTFVVSILYAFYAAVKAANVRIVSKK